MSMFGLKRFFDFGFNIKNTNYNTVNLAIISNLCMIFVLLLFGLLNLFIKGNTLLASIELSFAFFAYLTILRFRAKKNVKELLYLSTIIFFLISLLFYFFIEKVLFSAVWLFFFPLVAYLLNGLRIGTIFVAIYIVIILIYSYIGIGTYTDFIGFVHIAISLSIFSFFVYQFEKSRKEAYEKMMIAIKNLEEISRKDELTQLYNRHFLNTKILQNKALQQKNFLFCITDIDNFKLYNDLYGHQQGDKILKEIAGLKQEVIEDAQDSFVIRLGGEEFGAFIFDVKNPKEYIENFLKKLQEADLEHKGNNPYQCCTVSIGAVICNNKKGFDFTRVYQAADEALYKAKATGKNRVVYRELSSSS